MRGLPRILFFILATTVIAVAAEREAAANAEVVVGEFEAHASHVDFWHVRVDEPTTLQVDVLAYECSGVGCSDFFGNGVDNDLIDTIIWLGDGLAADPTAHPFVSGLIDVNDDCATPCSADGSVESLDSFIEVAIAPGDYVLAVEGLYAPDSGHYQLTFTALDTDTLAVTRPVGLNVDLGFHFGAPSGAFGGAPGVAGTWNEVGLPGSAPVDIFGRATAASISVSALTDSGWQFDAVADAELLPFDNIFSSSGNSWNVDFTGLAHGIYVLYLYAPAHPAVSTGDLTVNGTPVVGISGGGNSGALIKGSSYLAVPIYVDDGTLTISGSGGSISGLAGIQLVPEPNSLLLLGSGAVLLALLRWRKRVSKPGAGGESTSA